MVYRNIQKAIFIERKNRFLAICLVNDVEVPVHVKNTSRLTELLIKGAVAYVQYTPGEHRKTQYALIAIEKQGGALVNIDSQIPNVVIGDFLKAGGILPGMPMPATEIKAEQTHGESRFDFAFVCAEKPCLLEVKGVTLVNGQIAYFPGAPTLRGVKHLEGLVTARNEGYDTYVVFLIKMKGVEALMPNDETQPAFREALRRALYHGVHISAFTSIVAPNQIEINGQVPLVL